MTHDLKLLTGWGAKAFLEKRKPIFKVNRRAT